MSLHKVQQDILELSKSEDISQMSLRQIGERIGIKNSPQTVKHHLGQLQKNGFIKIDRNFNVFSSINKQVRSSVSFRQIPVLGSANCGKPTLIAEQLIDGFLQITPNALITNSKNVFAVKAIGNSMNKSRVNGQNIEDGDYVLIDPDNLTAKTGDYVLSIIEGCANIKRLKLDSVQHQIVLISESEENHPPIIISEKENYLLNGKVIQVVKAGSKKN